MPSKCRAGSTGRQILSPSSGGGSQSSAYIDRRTRDQVKNDIQSLRNHLNRPRTKDLRNNSLPCLTDELISPNRRIRNAKAPSLGGSPPSLLCGTQEAPARHRPLARSYSNLDDWARNSKGWDDGGPNALESVTDDAPAPAPPAPLRSQPPTPLSPDNTGGLGLGAALLDASRRPPSATSTGRISQRRPSGSESRDRPGSGNESHRLTNGAQLEPLRVNLSREGRPMSGSLSAGTLPQVIPAPAPALAVLDTQASRRNREDLSPIGHKSGTNNTGPQSSPVATPKRSPRPCSRGLCRQTLLATFDHGDHGGGSQSSRYGATGTDNNREAQTPRTCKSREEISAVSEDAVRARFQALHVDYEVPRQQLPEALAAMKWERRVDAARAEKVASEVVDERSFLDSREFLDFFSCYRRALVDSWAREFEAADTEGRGRLEAKEIVSLLSRHCGIIVLPGIVKELLRDIRDDDVDGPVATLEAYLHLRENAEKQAGFSKSELGAIMELFSRFDGSNPEERIKREEVEDAVRWTILRLGQEEHERDEDEDEPAEIDLDLLLKPLGYTEESLSKEQFVHVMWKHKELDIIKVAEFFTQEANSMNQLSSDTVARFMHKMGYSSVIPQDVMDCAEELLIEGSATFTQDEFYNIFRVFRQCEGFLKAEVMEKRRVFVAHDIDGSESMDIVELGGAIRWLGYPMNYETQQDLMDEVDVDKSGAIDFDEFMKIMRRYREAEHRLVKNTFHELDTEGIGIISQSQLQALLQACGYVNLNTEQQEVVRRESMAVSNVGYTKIIQAIRALQASSREDFQLAQGYSGKELDNFRQEFNQYDVKGTGVISKNHLAKLLEAKFPTSTLSSKGREMMLEIVAMVDRNHNKTLEWPEFLQLNRMIQNHADYAQVLAEQDAAERAGFSRTEVRDLRKIFKICDADASRNIDEQELLAVLSTIMPMSQEMWVNLSNLFKNVSAEGSVDFCGFLTLMRKVQDTVDFL